MPTFARRHRSRQITFLLSVAVLVGIAAHLLRVRFARFEVQHLSSSTAQIALTPDGGSVATFVYGDQVLPAAQGDRLTGEVELRVLNSRDPQAEVQLPTAVASSTVSVFKTSKWLQFCDTGKYLLAYNRSSTFYVFDARTLKLLFHVAFYPDDPMAEHTHPTEPGNVSLLVESACAADAPVVAFELASGLEGTGVTKFYNLDTGAPIGQVAEDVSSGTLMDLEVSPSGTTAAVVLERHPPATRPAQPHDLILIDIASRSVAQRLWTGMDLIQGAFVGDSEIAAASMSPDDPDIVVYDGRSGAPTRRFGIPGEIAGAPIATSADGHVLLAYTGAESVIKEALQIKQARFTLWNPQTGKIIARSPEIHVKRIATEALDLNPWSLKRSVRPFFQLNQSGNAVIVRSLFDSPTDLYRLKP